MSGKRVRPLVLVRPKPRSAQPRSSSAQSLGAGRGRLTSRVSSAEASVENDSAVKRALLENFRITRFIAAAGQRLRMPSVAVATAITLFHRFFQKCSEEKRKTDKHVLATACLYITVKVEELRDLRLRDVITVAYRCLRPDRLLTDESVYQPLRQRVLNTELLVLQTLSFSVKVEHVHKYLLHQLHLLVGWLGQNVCSQQALVQLSWNLLCDSIHLADVTLQTAPDVQALSALFLAVKTLHLDDDGQPLANFDWWQNLASDCNAETLQRVATQIMQVYHYDTPLAQG